MRTRPIALLTASVIALLSCGKGPEAERDNREKRDPETIPVALPPPSAAPTPPPVENAAPASAWQLLSSGEGDGLSLDRNGRRAVTLFCAAGDDNLLVNVAAFKPIASEERMSFGSGGRANILVAEPSGDRLRGGVSGSGPLPSDLAEILAAPGGISVNYGAQDAGPFEPIPSELSAAFQSGCSD